MFPASGAGDPAGTLAGAASCGACPAAANGPAPPSVRECLVAWRDPGVWKAPRALFNVSLASSSLAITCSIPGWSVLFEARVIISVIRMR